MERGRGFIWGIYFHRKLKLFRDALRNFQNFSEILNFKMADRVKFLEILAENSCVFFLNIHVFQEKLLIF